MNFTLDKTSLHEMGDELNSRVFLTLKFGLNLVDAPFLGVFLSGADRQTSVAEKAPRLASRWRHQRQIVTRVVLIFLQPAKLERAVG